MSKNSNTLKNDAMKILKDRTTNTIKRLNGEVFKRLLNDCDKWWDANITKALIKD